MACDTRLASLLREPTYADFERAWTALGAARPEVRASTLDALLRSIAQGRAMPAAVPERLRTIPAPERADALRRALSRAVDPAVYPSLRAELVLAAPNEPPPPLPTIAPPTPQQPPPRPAGDGRLAPPRVAPAEPT